MDKKVIWDSTIAIIRFFQAGFVKCVKALLTEASFTRWLNGMNSDYTEIENTAGQFVDLLNIKYLNMGTEKRLKNLSTLAKRIAEFRYDREHQEIKAVVSAAVRENGCEPEDICLQGIEYPENIEW
ncbi:MAG TPA: hypothetical protein VHO72_11750 [Bacteroidales bacterium]|nr:hypothetical protein [Bacteroidales bacterium]